MGGCGLDSSRQETDQWRGSCENCNGPSVSITFWNSLNLLLLFQMQLMQYWECLFWVPIDAHERQRMFTNVMWKAALEKLAVAQLVKKCCYVREHRLTCSTHEEYKKRLQKFWSETFKEIDHLGDLEVDGIMTLLECRTRRKELMNLSKLWQT
jgi:hypothetical protein